MSPRLRDASSYDAQRIAQDAHHHVVLASQSPADNPRCGRVTPSHSCGVSEGDSYVDNKRIEGMGHEAKGAVKETTGKLTGDRSQQIEGNLEKNAGKIERSVGRAEDDLRDNRDASTR